MFVQAHCPAPFTDLDKQRLNAWFEHDSRLPDLADELNTSVLDLAEWARQPHIAEALDTIANVARQRNATLRAEAQHAATARLLRIVRFCDHDEVARRAADRLLRSLPAGERPLYDEPEHLTDRPVHSPQPTARTSVAPQFPRTPSISVSTPTVPREARPQQTPPPPSPNPQRTINPTPPAAPTKPTRDDLVAAVLDAADRSGIPPDALDAPGFLEDLIFELNVRDEIDIDDLRDALQEAQTDRNSALVRVKAPP